MSTATQSIPAIERGSDWLNPILVKETRQALKSRQFVATFMLMLTASWMISVFGIVFEGAGAEFRPLGGGFFHAYSIVLAVAVFIVVPFGAFRSLLGERDQQTWEVLSITTLKPRQIVWGKLLSSMVQIYIYYSAITPFMAFAILLKGIDVPTIAVILVAALLWSLALSMIALTISTFGSQRVWQVFLTLGMIVGLLVGFFMALSVGGGMMYLFDFDSPQVWLGTAVIVSMLGAYCVLLLQVAIGQLTFDADNRTTGVRLAAAGVFWLGLVWTAASILLPGVWGFPGWSGTELNEFLKSIAIFAAVHWFVVGLFTTTESNVMSRRVRRNLARFGRFRIVLTPLVPGGARGFLYLSLHLAALVVFVAGMLAVNVHQEDSTVPFVIALCSYIFIYLGMGSAVGRVASWISGDFRPALARVTTILLIAVGAILPQLLYFFEMFRTGDRYPLFWITDPTSTLNRIGSGHTDSSMLLLIIAVGVVITLAVNLRGMLAAIADTARPLVVDPLASPRLVTAGTPLDAALSPAKDESRNSNE